jgi:hypothetical protein
MRRPAPLAALAVGLALAAAPSAAAAAGAPQVDAAWTTEVSAASASFHGEVNPEGESTTYRFEYLTDAAYQANPPGERFAGAARAPVTSSCPSSGCAGSGTSTVTVSQHASALRSATLYHYRLSATNAEGTNTAETNGAGSPLTFTTQGPGGAFALPDARGWELVSPPEKNGGAIQGPERNHGGGVLQAAAGGPGEITYSSASSFGGYEAQGAPQASQYISRRTGSGWATQNITAPTLSGAYGNDPNGVPYQLFSGDLARGLLLNGLHCRGEGTNCPVDAPVLEGSGAPPGYQDYYLRDDEAGSFQALLSEANDGLLTLSPEHFDLALAGASPDLRHVVLSTCAKLTADATEVPSGGGGCEASEPNLYEWSGGGLGLVNLLPGESQGTPGAKLAAQGGAVSEDGQRVYFADAGNLYLRRDATQPQSALGGGGECTEPARACTIEVNAGAQFQTATPNGAIAFYLKAEHLYRYEAATNTATDLTPAGGVEGVLGASADGSHVYYQSNGGILLPPISPGIFLWHEGAVTRVAPGAEAAQPSDYPPTTGTARVSADGKTLLFLSKEKLTGYDNADATTGLPDSEVYLYSAGALTCVSCNPTGERPIGPSSIPGAYANGTEAALVPGQILTDSYKPHALSANAHRVFFTSQDALVPLDTDRASDVYEWEAQGEGSCTKPGGCLSLISSGQGSEGASFIDASQSGEDAYFLTSASLVGADPGSADVYDARVGGGFAEPTPPIPCEGDACAPLPSPPEDPTVGTTIPGPGNPPVHFPKPSCPKGKRRVVSHGKTRCVPNHHKGRHHKRAHRRAARNPGGRK